MYYWHIISLLALTSICLTLVILPLCGDRPGPKQGSLKQGQRTRPRINRTAIPTRGLVSLPVFRDTDQENYVPFSCDHSAPPSASSSSSFSIFSVPGREQCDEVALDFTISRELSRPFENVDADMPMGYLYVIVGVTNATGDAIDKDDMRLVMQDRPNEKQRHFFKRTTVLIEPAPSNNAGSTEQGQRDRLSLHAKLPLSGYATIDRLPNVLHFRVQRRMATQDQTVVPVAVSEGHESVALSTDLFRKYFSTTYMSRVPYRVMKRVSRYNVLFFGVMGSGKSTEINTIISALGDRVHRIAETGGGTRHRTQKFAQYRVNNVIEGLGEIPINLFDTWGLGDGMWNSSALFRSIVKGELPMGHTMHDPFATEMDNKNKTNHATKKPEEDSHKIHAVLLFLSVDSAFDSDIVQQIQDTIEVAQKLDINPIIVATMSKDKTKQELHNIISRMQDMFKCPIFINEVYYEDVKEKVFEVDQNAFSLLDTALRAASDHLSKQYASNTVMDTDDTQDKHPEIVHFKVNRDQLLQWSIMAICLLVPAIVISSCRKSQPKKVFEGVDDDSLSLAQGADYFIPEIYSSNKPDDNTGTDTDADAAASAAEQMEE